MAKLKLKYSKKGKIYFFEIYEKKLFFSATYCNNKKNQTGS